MEKYSNSFFEEVFFKELQEIIDIFSFFKKTKYWDIISFEELQRYLIFKIKDNAIITAAFHHQYLLHKHVTLSYQYRIKKKFDTLKNFVNFEYENTDLNKDFFDSLLSLFRRILKAFSADPLILKEAYRNS